MNQSLDLLVFLGILTGILVSCYYLLLYCYQYSAYKLSYPPGPDSTSVSQLATSEPWVQYQSWGGKLIYIRDKNTLIINDSQTAIDLLEKRARIYSDRPVPHLMKLFGSELVMSMKPYSTEWRRDRKLFEQVFRQTTVSRFFPAQYSQIHEFLYNLTTSPEDFMQHTMALSQQLVYSSLYGLDIGPEHPLARKSVEIMVSIGQCLMPGFYPWAEKFPWLGFMPSWFPGCKFKQDIKQCRKDIKEVDTIPFNMAMNNLKMGTGTSVIAELALKGEGEPSKTEAIKSMGTISFLAAADTTMSSIAAFLLCMALHPDAQEKGQKELDHIVGKDRLPTFDDRRSLPYVEAIYREVMRLHPPGPIGMSHSPTEDDIYNGYHIPKGCTVVANIWAMNRNPDTYYEPDEFIPERFFDSPNGPFGKINDIYAFGFGRRICPGRYMAENTVWLTIASFLATMTIGKAKDNEGNEIDIPGEFTSTFFRHPKSFKALVTPRTPYTKELILATHSR